MLNYHAAYYRNPDTGWYVAEVIGFPGALSQGRTLQSARRMIRDALRMVAESMVEQGQPLPRPSQRRPTKKSLRADFIEPIDLKVRVMARAAS